MNSSDQAITTERRWDFNRWDDLDGWTIQEPLTGAVFGGALWLRISSGKPDPEKWTSSCQVYPPEESVTAYVRWMEWVTTGNITPHPASGDIASPRGLGLPAASFKKVRIRVRNLSPETDWLLFWRTADNPEADAGVVRASLEPYSQQWQELVFHVDDQWAGVIDQIRILPGLLRMRGDVCIGSIAITGGPPRPPVVRPDVCSEAVVPRVNIPGISQEEFADAFKILDEALCADVPVHGFKYPFLGPGGRYGRCWWIFDTSLNVNGAKWANQEFVEGVIRGLIGVQDPDGRFDLWGLSPMRGLAADSSAMPWYFEAAYDVARRTGDRDLVATIYRSMKAYLDWWLSPVKHDGPSGLITCTYEETHGEPLWEQPQTVAPVDLNVLVALGCGNVAELAESLGLADDAAFYRDAREALCQSMNQSMWSEQHGAYFNYHVRDRRPLERLICTTFEPMRLGIVTPERVDRLVQKLLDPALFNWGALPLTSLAKTEPDFVEMTGTYQTSAWFGNVWTMRNYSVVMALEHAGRHDLAAELAWTTIKAFNANWAESLVPSTGAGMGVARYGFSASQYIQLIIEHLFGIDYDRMRNRLRIFPHLPPELKDRELSISGLILPTGQDTRLNMRLRQSSDGQTQVCIELTQPMPGTALEFFQQVPPGATVQASDQEGNPLALIEGTGGITNVMGVHATLAKSVHLSLRSTGPSGPS